VTLRIHIITGRAIFLKKKGFGIHSDTKFGRRGGGVSYMNAREKRFQNAIPAGGLLRKNFWNGIVARSITKIPLITGISIFHQLIILT
jgi:hypothetical protein